MRARRFIRAIPPLTLVAAALVAAPPALAHTHVHVGDYELTIGWGNEPTYVGVPNLVEVTIVDEAGEPVTDLRAGDMTVVVSTADQSTEALPLEPQFVVGAFGTPGRYGADLLPTAPGDYTFTFAGTLRGEAVDVTVTSGDDTFSPVNGSTEIEFPVKVPTLADVATRLDRIDGRIEDLQAAAPGAGAIEAANANATAALDAANRAVLVGALVGGAGLVAAIIALFVAWGATRKGAGSA